MKKSIIAAAVAATVAFPAANAGVTIYGKVHVSIDHISSEGWYDLTEYNTGWASNQNRSDSWDTSLWQVQSRASRIGFKGTEDLGNGLSLIWKAETGYDFADGGAWNAARNAYIGLTGDWGTFLYGRHDTPYKMGYYATGIDMMGDTIMDMNQIGFNEVRASNAIAYVSPNMNGLTFAGAIVPGEGAGGDDGLADSYSLAAMYSNNGLKMAAGYESLGSGGDNSKWLVGGSYTMNAFTLALAYEDHEVNQNDAQTLGIAASYTFGNNTLVVNYANQDSDEILDIENYPSSYSNQNLVPVNGDATQWGIGLTHKLSKRTSAYAAYASIDADGSGENTDPSEGGSFAADASLDSFSVGMIHNF
jgi:predicted porin